MKIAPIAEIKAQFSSYVKAAEESPVVVTKNGKPVAMIVSITDEDEIERMMLAHSKKLKSILDEAEARIRATGGIRHEDFWNQMDAEYQDVEADSQAISAGAEKKGRTKSRSAPQPVAAPIPMPAIAEPKADYQVDAD
jgi:prevent-host-death family protein